MFKNYLKNKNLILTGMPGVGKSTVAKLLAQKLNLTLLDTDAKIQKSFNKSIAQIFSEGGELKFRQAESELLKLDPRLLGDDTGHIIATGAGFITHSQNLEKLKLNPNNIIFNLYADLEVLEKRINKNSGARPLLEPNQFLSRGSRIKSGMTAGASGMTALFNSRKDIYSQIFHQISTNNLSAEQVCEEIIEKLKLEKIFNKKKKTIWVTAPHTYPVFVKSESLAQNNLNIFNNFISYLGLEPDKVFVITHKSVAEACRLDSWIPDQVRDDGSVVYAPEGEKSKSIGEVENILNQLHKQGATRKSLLIAFGGGVIGDITGFAAATYMRGIDYIQIPTSLLAMVDSSVGGKCGVNLESGKNLVGAFHAPKGVLIDPMLLMSLPIIEYQNGMAEVIKHAIIGNRKLWDMLQDPEQIDPETMIIKSIRVKAHIVNQDFKEESTRMLLNFGHTFGHAIEKASNYEIKHGHAVGIGMVKAAQYAIKNNLCKDLDLDKKIIKILKTHGLPAEYAESEKQDIWELMQGDKKRMGKILRLILPKEINDVFRFDCAV